MVLSFCRGPGSIHALKRRGFRGLKVLSTENAVFIRSRQFRKRSSKSGCYRNDCLKSCVSRCPLLVECQASVSRGESTDKGQRVLPFICGMRPLIGGRRASRQAEILQKNHKCTFLWSAAYYKT